MVVHRPFGAASREPDAITRPAGTTSSATRELDDLMASLSEMTVVVRIIIVFYLVYYKVYSCSRYITHEFYILFDISNMASIFKF